MLLHRYFCFAVIHNASSSQFILFHNKCASSKLLKSVPSCWPGNSGTEVNIAWIFRFLSVLNINISLELSLICYHKLYSNRRWQQMPFRNFWSVPNFLFVLQTTKILTESRNTETKAFSFSRQKPRWNVTGMNSILKLHPERWTSNSSVA